MLEQKAMEYFMDHNCNCAESLLHAADCCWGLDLDASAFHAIGAFGGGMGCGGLCGALAGAVAALGACTIRTKAHEADMLKEKTTRMVEGFEREMGSQLCSILRPRYYDPQIKCATVVSCAARLLQAIHEVQDHA